MAKAPPKPARAAEKISTDPTLAPSTLNGTPGKTPNSTPPVSVATIAPGRLNATIPT